MYPICRLQKRVSSTPQQVNGRNSDEIVIVVVWWLVSYKECSNSVTLDWVGSVLASYACNWAQMASFSSRSALRLASCFYLSATISFAFLFWRASNGSWKLWITKAFSIYVDLIVKLLVVTVYFYDQRKFSSIPWWVPNVLTRIRCLLTCFDMYHSLCSSGTHPHQQRRDSYTQREGKKEWYRSE